MMESHRTHRNHGMAALLALTLTGLGCSMGTLDGFATTTFPRVHTCPPEPHLGPPASQVPILGSLVDTPLTEAALAAQGLPQTLEDPATAGAFEHLVHCALKDSQRVELEIEGVWVSFDGAAGLAPQWAEETCDQSCTLWVTACMRSRAALHGECLDAS